ncbi:MAG TPA: FUSC family protein [Conexibacter sp.]|jgi:uncharacterized membrane protein YccC
MAIFGPAAFAFAFVVLDDQKAAVFAIFGCFAQMAFAAFAGPLRARLTAYLGLAVAGAALVALGTLCCNSPALAASAMLVVGFVVLFSGVLGGPFVASSTGAILSFVLAVTIAAPIDDLPSRLLGWAIASAVSIPASLLLWPAHPHDRLRARAATACAQLGKLVKAIASDDARVIGTCQAAASRAAYDARRDFYATPFRAAAATGPTAALARVVDIVGWLVQFTMPLPPTSVPAGGLMLAGERAEVEEGVADLLDAAADRLRGGDAEPDFARVEQARKQLRETVLERVAAARPGEELAVERELEEGFRLRMLSYSAWYVVANALRASGSPAPPPDHTADPMEDRLGEAAVHAVRASSTLAAAYLSTRSVWFRNSVRGATGLALAVLIAQLVDLQHGFWVALGVISVLRSRAMTTGNTVVEALGGTLAGIVVGGAMVELIGSDTAILWAIFPLAVFAAVYAPRAISFFAGQAAFSLTVLILFNLVDPVGWSVGLVRIEDVAIGAAISLVVGLLMWPRGAAGLVRRCIDDAYSASAGELYATVALQLHDGDEEPVARHIAAAFTASNRLDDALRQFLADPGRDKLPFAELSRLRGGSEAMRRTAHSLRVGQIALPRPVTSASDDLRVKERAVLEEEALALSGWMRALGTAVGDDIAPPEPQPRDDDVAGGVRLLHGSGEPGAIGAAASLAWTRQHIVALRAIEPRLAAAAVALDRGPAEERKTPPPATPDAAPTERAPTGTATRPSAAS